MIHVKDGVDGAGIKPELVFNLFMAEEIYGAEGHPLVLTSVVRPSAGLGESLHPIGLAADLRIRSVAEDWPGGIWELADPEATAVKLREKCPQCQFIVESDHIHMEVQP